MIKSSLVYFVDEATASIDTATESALKQALLDHLTEPHMKDKATLLMICHRKETATGLCTKLMVMEDGEVESFTALEGAK
jgi:ABC-type multidrug transport system fused ATPase/permease subunit